MMTDDEREAFILQNRIVNVDAAFVFRRLRAARDRRSDPHAELRAMVDEERRDERRRTGESWP